MHRGVTVADNPLVLLFAKLNRHVDLDNSDRDALLALPYTRRLFPAATYLFSEGGAPGPCPVLIAGYAIRNKLTKSGARQILSVQLPGEALDLQQLFLDIADHNVQALTAVEVALVPRKELRRLVMDRTNIAHAVAVSNQVDGSIFREWVLNVGRRNARERLAHLLCELATRLEHQELASSMGLELPMTQEQLGDATGLTAVHVNRTLRALEFEGLITRSKRAVMFPNWQRLRAVAGFSETYLHLGQQKAAS
jgi:CRP-like cAMP-binding protein